MQLLPSPLPAANFCSEVTAMTPMKDLIFDVQARVAIAENLAVEAGILRRCPFHEFTYQESWDLDRAYRIAVRRFKKGDIPGPFSSQEDVTDAIKAVVDNAPLDCPRCQKIREDD
jgi:hypothetical protein